MFLRFRQTITYVFSLIKLSRISSEDRILLFKVSCCGLWSDALDAKTEYLCDNMKWYEEVKKQCKNWQKFMEQLLSTVIYLPMPDEPLSMKREVTNEINCNLEEQNNVMQLSLHHHAIEKFAGFCESPFFFFFWFFK